MVSLVQKVLFPMDLKRYMALSFATLWTFLLVIALIATIVHQVHFQESSDKLHLESEIKGLKADLSTKDQKILELEEKFKKITEWWYYP